MKKTRLHQHFLIRTAFLLYTEEEKTEIASIEQELPYSE